MNVFAKPCVSFLPIYLVREVSLEYLSQEISILGKLKIVLKRFIALAQSNFFDLLIQIFVFYAVEIDDAFSEHGPLEVHCLENREVWLSRSAIVSGFLPQQFSRNIEYDLLRRKEIKRLTVWSSSRIERMDAICLIKNPFFPARRLDGEYALDNNGKTSHTVFRAEVVSGHCLVVNNQYLRIRAAFPEFDTCWPSEFPTRIQNRLYLPISINSIKLEKGVFVSHSNSWFHFIVEILVYLSSIEVSARSNPVLIPKGTPPQIKELMFYLGYSNILEIELQSSVLVEELITISDSKRTSFSEFNNSYGVNLELVRTICLDLFSFRKPLNKVRNRKVFLGRENHLLRGFSNSDEINTLLESHGVEIVYPEKMSALEQFELINECSLVIAESGAAITSLLFSKHLLVFLELRPYLGTSKYFWQNFIESLGHQYFSIDASPPKWLQFSSNFRSNMNLDLLNDIVLTISRVENH